MSPSSSISREFDDKNKCLMYVHFLVVLLLSIHHRLITCPGTLAENNMTFHFGTIEHFGQLMGHFLMLTYISGRVLRSASSYQSGISVLGFLYSSSWVGSVWTGNRCKYTDCIMGMHNGIFDGTYFEEMLRNWIAVIDDFREKTTAIVKRNSHPLSIWESNLLSNTPTP